jgi:hypothetical protein
MDQAARPDDWIIYATLALLAIVMGGYAIWSIRSGYIHMRPGWRVRRQDEPAFFWFATLTTGFVPIAALAVAAWELNR